MRTLDAIVIGAGPNGLAAAITIAQTGRSVRVYESHVTAGGGCRSAALTLPGFVHDVCSAVYPLAAAFPFFRTLPLARYGLEWIDSPALLAHPIDEREVVPLYRSVSQTADALGADGAAYRRVFEPLVESWPALEAWTSARWSWPPRPLAVAVRGLQALGSAQRLVSRCFSGRAARALFAGVAAHGMRPLEARPTAAIGLGLMLAGHVGGWPLPRGGAQRLTDALVAHLHALGGEIVTNMPVATLDELPASRVVLLDLSPQPVLRLAGSRLPSRYRRALERYKYGSGVYKVDWALDSPIPWAHRDCALAATVHIGGDFDDIAASERMTATGHAPDRPFVLLVQPSLFDPDRAPPDRHTAWAYCHVPAASSIDMLARIEAQIERYAPGFTAHVLARSVVSPRDLERYNPNFVGGDIGAGAFTLGQLLMRPAWHTHATPVRGLYICSASTPPGVGVHGMCGHLAARRALRDVLRD